MQVENICLAQWPLRQHCCKKKQYVLVCTALAEEAYLFLMYSFSQYKSVCFGGRFLTHFHLDILGGSFLLEFFFPNRNMYSKRTGHYS